MTLMTSGTQFPEADPPYIKGDKEEAVKSGAEPQMLDKCQRSPRATLIFRSIAPLRAAGRGDAANLLPGAFSEKCKN